MGCRTRTISATAATLGTLLLLVPVAAAEAGGTPYTTAASSGGSEYGAPLARAKPPKPIARVFGVSPARVTSPNLPAVRFRVDQPSARTVSARIVFWPVGRGTIARLELGRVATGRSVSVRWPEGFAVRPGRYVVRLHVKGRGGQVLARRAAAGVSGRANLVVRAAPKPTVAPPPAPAPAPVSGGATPPLATTIGVFPVQGPHTYGDVFGAPRKGYSHQGQDVVGAEGTPIVAPVAGAVTFVDYQASAAGWYVVQHADDGRDFFFAHCRANTVTVTPGQRVTPGTHLCDMGQTGDASGPHLHFEIWEGGWRTSTASRPIDPLPQLKAWDR